jgi:hypothetical protein
LTWLKEASVQCGEIRNGSWLPDYQGDWRPLFPNSVH